MGGGVGWGGEWSLLDPALSRHQRETFKVQGPICLALRRVLMESIDVKVSNESFILYVLLLVCSEVISYIL